MEIRGTHSPALGAALTMCVGIVAGYYSVPTLDAVLFWILFGAALIAALVLRRVLAVRGIMFAVVTFFAGFSLGAGSRTNPLPDDLAEKQGVLTGTVQKVTTVAHGARLVVHADKWLQVKDSVARPVDFNTVCTVPGITGDIAVGATVEIQGRLRDIRQSLDVPYQTDFNRYLFLDKVGGRITVLKPDDVAVDNGTASAFRRFMLRCRGEWLSAIVTAGFDSETTDFLLAVIGGEERLFDSGLQEEFRQTGMSHILAISGLHVGIVISLIAFLLYPLKLISRLRPFWFVLLGLSAVFFALLTGGSPSSCRAALMCCLIAGNRIFEIRTNPLQTLSLAVIILLCFNPLWLFAPGFQFSVCGVLALISFAPVFNLVSSRRPVLKAVWTAMMVPIVALTGTLIPTIFYFHTVSVNFWLPNIIGSVLVPVVLSFGFIGSILSLLGLHFPPVVDITDWVYSLFVKVIHYLTEVMPVNRVPVILEVDSLLLIGAVIAVVVWLVWHYSHRRCAFVAVASVVALLFLPLSAESCPESELYIPRHKTTSDIILLHDNVSYLWTTADDSLAIKSATVHADRNYGDFYRRRRVEPEPTIVSEGFAAPGLSIHGNLLTINNRTLLRVHSDTVPLPSSQVDVALVTERYTGEMIDLVKTVRADTILLSAAINYSRHRKFVRQLDTLGVAYRSLRDRGLVWHFH